MPIARLAHPLAAALLMAAAPAAADELSYFAPGDLAKAEPGIASRGVALPDLDFPMKVGTATRQHAYMGSQLALYTGVRDANDPRLYNYPHRDNQCEGQRSWKVLACPTGIGHQGVDIRAHDNRDKVWDVVAVEDGLVTAVSNFTTVAVKNGRRTVRYMHMDRASITDAGIRVNTQVRKGQVLGRVSCVMHGSCQTSRHLHLDAYSGTASGGDFYNIYASLIPAYRRAWGLDSGIVDGALAVDPLHEVSVAPAPSDRPRPTVPTAETCSAASLGATPAGVDAGALVSLWMHNCSVIGLVADTVTGERRFVYVRPKTSLGAVVTGDPVLFVGRNDAGAYTGKAKAYSERCGALAYDVSGRASDTVPPVVRMSGMRPRRDAACRVTGSVADELVFTYSSSVQPPVDGLPSAPPAGRTELSEITRNFLAITFYPDGNKPIALLPYFASFPGLAPQRGEMDSNGGLIPRLASDEAGVAISWVWLRKRAQFANETALTPRRAAHSMAGVDPSMCNAAVQPTAAAVSALGAASAGRACDRVSAYLRGYVGFANGRNFAASYFGRTVALDETLNLTVPATAWNWMRTMYSHESGRPPVIDEATFHRGVAYGNDYVAAFYDGDAARLRPTSFYSDPCNFTGTSGCGGSVPAPGSTGGSGSGENDAALRAAVAALADTVRTLSDKVHTLETLLARH